MRLWKKVIFHGAGETATMHYVYIATTLPFSPLLVYSIDKYKRTEGAGNQNSDHGTKKGHIMELKVDIAQKQILSQNMVQAMEILQMSAQELESYIENLALENPVIELPDSYSSQTNTKQEDLQRKLDWLESSDYQNKVYYQQERSAENMQADWHDSRCSEENLSDYLLSQLLLAEYSGQDRAIVEFLIHSLDSKGYLTDDIPSIAKYFSVPEERILRLLADIQELDPAGVGARNLRECLLLQLNRKKDPSNLTRKLIEHHMDDIAKNHLHEIAKKLRITMAEVEKSCEEIRSLNPKPGSSFSSREQLRYISPDAVVVKLADKFEILINEYQYPHFTISAYYQDLLENTSDEEAKKYLQEKIRQAQWVTNCISQRSSTLSLVMHTLVEKQHDFFMNGAGHKRPMRLADIAARLQLHESTVCRAMRGKYLQCSWGVFPLNYFLTPIAARSFGENGEEKTPDQIKEAIRQIIHEEDKTRPLSDQSVCDRLLDFGIRISRRTVNKYRTEMNIPDKSGRKKWE